MSHASSMRSLWYKWKSFKLPWRKSRLIGQDLSGTTFWELRNDNLPSRPRRMAVYPQKTHHSDVNLDPAWIQWLRHTRPLAPSIQEQQLEVQRQAQLKQLAAAADHRWAEKPSFLDKPEDTEQLPPEVLEPRDKARYGREDFIEEDMHRELGANAGKSVVGDESGFADKTEGRDREESRRGRASRERHTERAENKESPWAKHTGSPNEEWQPDSWSPGRMDRR